MLGCTNSSAVNFNSRATASDGSCKAPVYGCTDPSASNFNPFATPNSSPTHISSHSFPHPLASPLPLPCRYGGCSLSLATNFWSLATFDDGSCVFASPSCNDPRALNFVGWEREGKGEGEAQRERVWPREVATCLYAGCTHPAAFNFEPTASLDDGSCTFAISKPLPPTAYRSRRLNRPFRRLQLQANATNSSGGCPQGVIDLATSSGGPPPVCGCGLEAATNYDSTVTFTDGSCSIPGCLDSAAANYDPTSTLQVAGSCEYDVVGCVVVSAANYDSLATVDSGECFFPMLGCTDSTPTLPTPLCGLALGLRFRIRVRVRALGLGLGVGLGLGG